jgi:hypothetical protein
MARKYLFLFPLIFASTQVLMGQQRLSEGLGMFGTGVNIGLSRDASTNQDFLNNTLQQQLNSSNVDGKVFSAGLNPTYGRMTSDYTMIGLRLSYAFNRRSFTNEFQSAEESPVQTGTSEGSSHALGLNTFYRFYFPVHDRFGAYVEGDAGYQRSWGTSESDNVFTIRDSEFSRNTFSLKVSLGVYAFLTERLMLESTMGQIQYRYSFDSSKSSRSGFLTSESSSSRDSGGFSVRLINQLRFDQLLRLNYFF